MDQQTAAAVADVLNHAGSVEVLGKQDGRPMAAAPLVVPVFYF